MSTYNDASLIYYPSGYKAGKAYSLKPTDGSGDLTFTRASTATRVNAEGLIESVATGVPRIDFTGGGCGKLLLEPQRTNSITQSTNLSLFSKTSANLIVNGGQVSPNTTNNAFKIIAGNLDSRYAIFSNDITTINASNYSVSMSFKPSEYYKAGYRDGYTGKYVTFDLISKTQLASTGPTVTFTDQANGYIRVVINYVSTTTNNNNYFFILDNAYVNQNPATYTFVGDGSSGLFMCNPQHELGSYPTSYIPTTTTAVTRVADSASKTGISSLINSPEGSFYVEAKALFNGGSFRQFSLSNGTDNSRLTMGWSSVESRLLVRLDIGGTNIINTDILSFNQTSNNKVLFKWVSGNFKVFINGVEKLSLTSLTMPTANLFTKLGFDRGSSAGFFEGNVQSVMIFPAALSDTDAIALTTL